MGASWRGPGGAVLLLVVAAALAPVAHAGTAAAPEVTDPAGDQAIDRGTVPTVPGVNEPAFDDVDLLGAFVGEFGNLTRITVQTTAGWTTGSMTVSFAVTKGPTSLPASTAHGQGFTLVVNGTTATGAASITAAGTTDGLRIDVPSKALGATGGDLLTNLTINTTRTDPGALQGVTQDDQTATDTAGPGTAYTFARPPVAGHLRLDPVTAATLEFTGQSLKVGFRLINDGLDADTVTLTLDPAGLTGSFPSGASTQTITLPGGATATTNVTFEMGPGGKAGTAGDHAVTVSAASKLGGTAQAQVTIRIPATVVPPTVREVKPAGLGFLTSTAERAHFDDAFGSYAELALLSLVVLFVIVVLFLLLAVGRSTIEAEPATVAPWPDEAPAPRVASRAGPAGVMETVRATPPAPPAEEAAEPEMDALGIAAALAQPDEADDEPAPPEPAPMPIAPSGGGIRIEEVRHTPSQPEAGQGVTTEVILRNDGPATALRIALSIDGNPAAERTVQVPSRATKAVELPWTAGPGDNRVRIQAFPA